MVDVDVQDPHSRFPELPSNHLTIGSLLADESFARTGLEDRYIYSNEDKLSEQNAAGRPKSLRDKLLSETTVRDAAQQRLENSVAKALLNVPKNFRGTTAPFVQVKLESLPISAQNRLLWLSQRDAEIFLEEKARKKEEVQERKRCLAKSAVKLKVWREAKDRQYKEDQERFGKEAEETNRAEAEERERWKRRSRALKDRVDRDYCLKCDEADRKAREDKESNAKARKEGARKLKQRSDAMKQSLARWYVQRSNAQSEATQEWPTAMVGTTNEEAANQWLRQISSILDEDEDVTTREEAANQWLRQISNIPDEDEDVTTREEFANQWVRQTSKMPDENQ